MGLAEHSRDNCSVDFRVDRSIHRLLPFCRKDSTLVHLPGETGRSQAFQLGLAGFNQGVWCSSSPAAFQKQLYNASSRWDGAAWTRVDHDTRSTQGPPDRGQAMPADQPSSTAAPPPAPSDSFTAPVLHFAAQSVGDLLNIHLPEHLSQIRAGEGDPSTTETIASRAISKVGVLWAM